MFIQESDLFKGMSQGCMNELAKIMIAETHAAGTFLFKEGDPADCFYVLEQGRIKLSIGEKGHLVYILSNQGELCGWSGLADLNVYTATAECLTPTKLIKIEKEKLNDLFKKYSADGVLFFRRLAGIIGKRLISTYNALLSSQQPERSLSYG